MLILTSTKNLFFNQTSSSNVKVENFSFNLFINMFIFSNFCYFRLYLKEPFYFIIFVFSLELTDCIKVKQKAKKLKETFLSQPYSDAVNNQVNSLNLRSFFRYQIIVVESFPFFSFVFNI